jgi:hypothetical protein
VTDRHPVRGGIYPYTGNLRRSDFLVVSVDALNDAGTVIVLEVADEVLGDVRGLLATQLADDDPQTGRWVLGWRINYARADRFDVAGGHGVVSAETMAKVLGSVKAAIEPL